MDGDLVQAITFKLGDVADPVERKHLHLAGRLGERQVIAVGALLRSAVQAEPRLPVDCGRDSRPADLLLDDREVKVVFPLAAVEIMTD